MSIRAFIRLFIPTLLMAAILAACGSSGSGTTTGSATTASSSAPTKAVFISEGDAVCLKLAGRAAEAFERRTKDREEHPNRVQTPQEELEEVNLISMPGFQKEAEELGELVPPQGDEKEVEAIVVAIEGAVTAMRNNPALPLNTSPESPFYHSDQLARNYGFKVCGH